ncbi:NAD-dependent epimerase/dehydratase family protein [Gilvibacter sp.]|uniref:NAD-dependent epimerase/dehydratase family protein n=1 Tax=Gilvibacter sp. TaxID=2729997 RepID=UPI003F4A85BB
MKVLVTGAAGFIGSHTAERLQALSHEVVAVDNFSPYYDVSLKERNAKELAEKGIVVQSVDLRDGNLETKLPTDIEYIFHFAAQPGISQKSTFDDYLTNNIIATQRLLQYTQHCPNFKFFVNIATSSIYGLVATYPEAEAPKPASYYGVTKLAAEQLVLAYERDGLLQGCSLRLYSVYGPRERPDKLYTKLILCGLEGTSFPLFEGSQQHLRSFTYVDDIVDGIVAVMGRETSCSGEVINLGTETESTTAEGITTVEELLGMRIPMDMRPARPGDQSRTKANIEKAKLLLNYNPQTTLRAGLEKQVAWVKKISGGI